jgi:hypothetical protein
MPSDLEASLKPLIDLKAINLDVTFGSSLKGGALAGDDPWDIWCGNGWILRRRGPGPIRIDQIEGLRGDVLALRRDLDAALSKLGNR